MAEPTQYTFSLREVAETLIKKQGLHEGKWLIGLEMGINAGIMGIDKDKARPGAMVIMNAIQLTRALPDAPAQLVIDAAAINPAKD